MFVEDMRRVFQEDGCHSGVSSEEFIKRRKWKYFIVNSEEVLNFCSSPAPGNHFCTLIRFLVKYPPSQDLP